METLDKLNKDSSITRIGISNDIQCNSSIILIMFKNEHGSNIESLQSLIKSIIECIIF